MDCELRPLDDVLPAALFGVQTSRVKLAQGVPDLDALKKLVANPNANPMAIADAMDVATQKEWRDWDPKMLWEYLDLSDEDVQQQDKVMATQVALTNPDVFDDWTLFTNVNNAFNHRRTSFDWMHETDPLELAWTCSVLRALQPNQQFGPGVVRYLGVVCLMDGTVFFPWLGGDGLAFCASPYREMFQGLVDPEMCAVAKRVQEHWRAGDLAELAPGDINESDPFHVQMAKVVAAQSYIRAQRPRDPGAQGAAA